MSYLTIARGLEQPDTSTAEAYRAYRAAPEITPPPVADSPSPPRACAESAICAVSPPPYSDPAYAPLDDVIAADEAAKYPHPTIVARVERLRLVAADPDATPLDRAVCDDWERILTFKERTP